MNLIFEIAYSLGLSSFLWMPRNLYFPRDCLSVYKWRPPWIPAILPVWPDARLRRRLWNHLYFHWSVPAEACAWECWADRVTARDIRATFDPLWFPRRGCSRAKKQPLPSPPVWPPIGEGSPACPWLLTLGWWDILTENFWMHLKTKFGAVFLAITWLHSVSITSVVSLVLAGDDIHRVIFLICHCPIC